MRPTARSRRSWALTTAALAAIRETIEETGVPVGLSPLPDARTAIELQRELALGERLRRRCSASTGWRSTPARSRRSPAGCRSSMRCGGSTPCSSSPSCPPGDWRPRVIDGECAAAAWVTAAEVLEREQRGQARLIFPTRRTLERLAQHCSFEEIRADALAHPIEPVTPWVEERDGEKFITIPAHLGFPVTQERLDGLWRG